jgi:hypothetical protein
MKHHATNKHNLILLQPDWQNQPQSDTRNQKAPLWPSTPAPCWAAFEMERPLPIIPTPVASTKYIQQIEMSLSFHQGQ